MKRLALFLLVLSLTFPFFVQAKKDPLWIRINLMERNLYVMQGKEIRKVYTVTIGREDSPTPVGTWKIVRKCIGWGGGFGPRWMELNVPWGLYGIHGTNKSYLMGQEASQGCIRLRNKEIKELYTMIPHGTKVVVEGPIMGFSHWSLKRLKEGDRGIVVYYVQKKLKEKKYYTGTVDGIYGPALQKAVNQFQKENHLEETGTVYRTEYRILGLLFQ